MSASVMWSQNHKEQQQQQFVNMSKTKRAFSAKCERMWLLVSPNHRENTETAVGGGISFRSHRGDAVVLIIAEFVHRGLAASLAAPRQQQQQQQHQRLAVASYRSLAGTTNSLQLDLPCCRSGSWSTRGRR